MMTIDYGFKVSKQGQNVLTATPDQLLFSSKYPTLRVQQKGSGVITQSGGRTVTIPHNLGYVPMFIAHGNIFGGNYYFNLPASVNRGSLFVTKPDEIALAYADETNLYIKLNNDFGYDIYPIEGGTGGWATRSSGGSHWYDFAEAGKYGNNYDMALRFLGINLSLAQVPYSAQIVFHILNRSGNNDIFLRLWGIEQGNTAPFSSGNDPWSRPLHDGSSPVDIHIGSGAQDGSTEVFDVKNIVSEIAGVGSWVSGNAMGFIINENGSSNENTIQSSYDTYLKILKSNTLLNYKYTIFKDKII